MHPNVKVIRTEEAIDYDTAGKPYPVIRTMWKFGEAHGPFFDRAPKEGWSTAGFEDRIRDHVNQLAALNP